MPHWQVLGELLGLEGRRATLELPAVSSTVDVRMPFESSGANPRQIVYLFVADRGRARDRPQTTSKVIPCLRAVAVARATARKQT